MAKHHPDLIFCRKQAGVGELVPCSLLFKWDGMRNWGLGGFASSFGLWFGGSTFRALRSLGILEARSGLWRLMRGRERPTLLWIWEGSGQLSGQSFGAKQKLGA